MINVIGFITKNKHKKITLKVYVLTGWYRILINTIPMKYLEKHFGMKGYESSDEITPEQYKYAKLVSTYVNRSADKTLWESKCLVRALTARTLLKQKNIDSTLYLGVREEEQRMQAHAWIRCGKMYVTGGNGVGFTVVEKFGK